MENQVPMRFFLPPADKAKLTRVARSEGLSASAWLRQRLKRLLAESPDPELPAEEVST